MRIRPWVLALAGLVVALAVAACGGGSSSSSSGGGGGGGESAASSGGSETTSGQTSGGGAAEGSITIALGAEPTTLDPQLKVDGSEAAVNRNVYETLMARTADGKLEPGLAAAPPTQTSPTTWRVKLRPDIKFSDGEPLNADAVVYSVERIINKKYNSEQLDFVSTIKGAKKVDDLTVDIETTAPDPLLPSRLYWLTIVPPQAAQKAGFADHSIGTGPYTFVEWAKGDHITLKANPNYWGEPKPSIETVTFKFVPEGGTRLSGLLAGDYDLITNLLPEDAKSVPKFAAVDGTEHPMMILNARPGSQVTANVKVRQALNYAVDKDAIAKNLFGGYAKVDQCQILSPSFFGYNKSLKAYPYDPDKAKQLLQEAGAVGKTITIVGESGRWLKDKEMIEAIAQFWRSAGLKVNTQIVSFDEYLNRLFDQKSRPDSIFVSASNELLDADRELSTYYASTGSGSSNQDKELQRLVDEGRSETDVAKRQSIYDQADKLACDNAYFLFLINNEDLYGLSQRLDYQPRQDGFIYAKTMTLEK